MISYRYGPWGAPTATGVGELAKINPCAYRGYYYDQETGCYYLQSRYCDQYDYRVNFFLISFFCLDYVVGE